VRGVLGRHLVPRGISRRAIIAGAVVLAGAAAFAVFRPGARDLPEGFLVGDEKTLHATLGEAVAVAGPGDTVVVRRNGKIEKLFELKGALGETTGKPGFDRLLLGPENPNDLWRKPEAYGQWWRAGHDALRPGPQATPPPPG
jgi:hypothetical protein